MHINAFARRLEYRGTVKIDSADNRDAYSAGVWT